MNPLVFIVLAVVCILLVGELTSYIIKIPYHMACIIITIIVIIVIFLCDR